jgi:YggT family protein
MPSVIFALARLVDLALSLYIWIIIARAILSWVNPNPYHPLVRLIISLTEPVLAPIRRRLPLMGGIDFTPMLLIVVILFLKRFLIGILIQLAASSG